MGHAYRHVRHGACLYCHGNFVCYTFPLFEDLGTWRCSRINTHDGMQEHNKFTANFRQMLFTVVKQRVDSNILGATLQYGPLFLNISDREVV